MKYIDAIKGSLVALIMFALAAWFIPGVGPSDDVQLILTVSTFLFAILYGFFITKSFKRYDDIEGSLATEDAYWASFYRTAKLFGEDFQVKIRELLDQYYMATFDYPINSYYVPTATRLTAVYDALISMKELKGNQADNVYDDMFVFLASIEDARNKTSVDADRDITRGQWALLIVLTGIIMFSLFFLKNKEFYSFVITVLLSSMLLLVLLILRDVNNLRLGGKMIAAESGQQIFELIGKTRYYSHTYLKDGTTKVPSHIREYRHGLHQPGEEPNIEVVQNG